MTNKATWDDFCAWLLDDMHLGDMMFILKDAIESNSPRSFIPYTQF